MVDSLVSLLSCELSAWDVAVVIGGLGIFRRGDRNHISASHPHAIRCISNAAYSPPLSLSPLISDRRFLSKKQLTCFFLGYLTFSISYLPFSAKLPTRTPERSQAHTPPPNRLEKWRISVLHLGI
ncbi:hypothetical protein AAC387_Pa09g1119 [Persea americana]